MKRPSWLFLPLVLASGCSTHTTVAYRTAIRISPAAEAGLYDVEAQLLRQTVRTSVSPFHSRMSTQTDTIAAPKLTCKPAEAAAVTVAADGSNEAILLSAYIGKAADGKESVCTLTVKQQAQVVSSAEVRVPPLSP